MNQVVGEVQVIRVVTRPAFPDPGGRGRMWRKRPACSHVSDGQRERDGCTGFEKASVIRHFEPCLGVRRMRPKTVMPTNSDRDRELTTSLGAWLDRAFSSSVPETIVAFNVNLYDEPFRADLVGAECYDADDADRACAEDWVPKDRFFDFPADLGQLPWEERLSLVREALEELLAGDGRAATRLKSSTAVTVGFVDGDLEIVHAGAA